MPDNDFINIKAQIADMCEEWDIAVTMATLESYNHISGDIRRGLLLFRKGGIEYIKDDSVYYRVIVPVDEKSHKSVAVTFSEDGCGLDDFRCGCTYLTKKHGQLCRHVVAAVLEIQGGVVCRNEV